MKLSCENIGMCLSCVPFTLVIRLINSWDFIQVRYDNKMLSSQWDNDNQHFVYIIISWYLLGIITRQGFLFSCSCMNRCTCFVLKHERRGINLLKNIVALSAMKNRLLWCLIQFLYRDHPWIHIPYWTNTLHLPCCGKNRPLHNMHYNFIQCIVIFIWTCHVTNKYNEIIFLKENVNLLFNVIYNRRIGIGYLLNWFWPSDAIWWRRSGQYGFR